MRLVLKSSFTVTNGPHRLRSLRKFLRDHPNFRMTQLRTPLNESLEQLLAFSALEGSSLDKVQKNIEEIRASFRENDLFVDRVRISVPFSEQMYLVEHQIESLYHLQDHSFTVSRTYDEYILEKCRRHQLMVGYDVQSIMEKGARRHWYVWKRYNENGYSARQDFYEAMHDLLHIIGVLDIPNCFPSSVILDDNLSDDELWLAY